VGPGAHSYDGSAVRSWNARDLDGYLEAVRSGRRPVAGEDWLDGQTRSFEAIALGLRRIDGVSRAEYRREFGEDPVEQHTDAVATGISAGLLELDEEHIRLSPRGRLFATEALVAFAPTTSSVR
jgi:oxygen-independent coproporphyrinogen-3 oxidase